MNLLEAKFVAGVKSKEKAFTERDGGGLFLVVEPSGKNGGNIEEFLREKRLLFLLVRFQMLPLLKHENNGTR